MKGMNILLCDAYKMKGSTDKKKHEKHEYNFGIIILNCLRNGN